MVCPPIRGDNPRALASFSQVHVQVESHGITTSYNLFQSRPFTLRGILS